MTETVHLLGLLGRRRAAGADGPDRLVGDDRLRQHGRRIVIEHRVELAADHRARAPGLALGERLAHAHDGRQAAAAGHRHLGRHPLVTLPVQGAPLGVADDDVMDAEIAQHRSGHLAGERPLLVLAQVLRPQAHRARAEPLGHQRQVHERRTHGQLHVPGAGPGQDTVEQGGDRAAIAVHLPVSGYQGGTHANTSGRAAREAGGKRSRWRRADQMRRAGQRAASTHSAHNGRGRHTFLPWVTSSAWYSLYRAASGPSAVSIRARRIS